MSVKKSAACQDVDSFKTWGFEGAILCVPIFSALRDGFHVRLRQLLLGHASLCVAVGRIIGRAVILAFIHACTHAESNYTRIRNTCIDCVKLVLKLAHGHAKLVKLIHFYKKNDEGSHFFFICKMV